MAYLVFSDIKGKIPEKYLTEGTTDGGVSLFAEIEADAAGQVDAIIGLRYPVPRTAPIEPVIFEAAKVAFAYLCYQRRGVSDEVNPWKSRFDAYFAANGILMKIANGTTPLAPGVKKATPVAALISEPSKTFDSAGRRLS